MLITVAESVWADVIDRAFPAVKETLHPPSTMVDNIVHLRDRTRRGIDDLDGRSHRRDCRKINSTPRDDRCMRLLSHWRLGQSSGRAEDLDQAGCRKI